MRTSTVNVYLDPMLLSEQAFLFLILFNASRSSGVNSFPSQNRHLPPLPKALLPVPTLQADTTIPFLQIPFKLPSTLLSASVLASINCFHLCRASCLFHHGQILRHFHFSAQTPLRHLACFLLLRLMLYNDENKQVTRCEAPRQVHDSLHFHPQL